MTEEKIKKPIWKRWWFWVLAVIVIIGIIGSGDNEDNLEVSSPTPVVVKGKQKEVAEIEVDDMATVEAQKEAYMAWENRILELHGFADEAYAIFQNVVQQASEGNKDEYTAYSEIKELKGFIDGARTKIREVKPGEVLSKEHIKKLNEAQSNLATGLYSKSSGMGKMLKFLDDPKPSLIEEARRDFQTSESLMLKGIAQFTEVRLELGVED